MSGLISLFIDKFCNIFQKVAIRLAMQATAFDQQAAQSLGVSVNKYFRQLGEFST